MQDVLDQPDAAAGDEPSIQTSGRRKRRLIIAVAVALVAVLGVPPVLHSLAWVSTDDAFIEAHVVTLAPKIADHVARVLVADNQRVEAGQTLLQLDGRDYAAKRDQARAELLAAQAAGQEAAASLALTRKTSGAGLEQATSGIDYAKSTIKTAQAQAREAASAVAQAETQVKAARATQQAAQAEADRARADMSRYEHVIDGAVSRQQVDQAKATWISAKASLQAAGENVRAAEAKLVQAHAAEHASQAQVAQTEASLGAASGKLHEADVTAERVAQAEAALASANAQAELAKASLAAAELQVSYATIKAPAAGRVTHRTVEGGDYVQPSQPLLAIVPDEMWVVANFKETQLTDMRPGQPAEIEVDSLGGRKLKGHVESIQAGTGARFALLPAENATGNYVKVVQRVPVKIVFDEKPEALAGISPGMSVTPDVKVK